MWRPSRRHSKQRDSTAGCCTTSAARTRLPARLAGIGEGGGHLATRRWFYLVPSSGEPRGLVHAIERHNLDHLPGPQVDLRRASAARIRPEGATDRTWVASPWSTRRAMRIPYVSRVDAGTIEMVRDTGVLGPQQRGPRAALRRVVRRSRHRLTSQGLGQALPRKGSRPLRRLPNDLRPGHPNNGIRHPTIDDPAGSPRRGSSPNRLRTSRPRRMRATRTTCRPRTSIAASVRTSWSCSISGARGRRRALFTPISPGWGSPAPQVPERISRAFDTIARRPGRGRVAG